MRLVDQGNDVAAFVECARFSVGCLAELEDRRDDDLAYILRQQLLQLVAGLGLLQIRDIGPGKGAGDLGIEVDGNRSPPPMKSLLKQPVTGDNSGT